MPSGFAFLFVVVLVIGGAITLWKITTAQRLARQSGMDPGLATEVRLLSDDGLGATYLASSLRQPAAPTSPEAPDLPAPAR